MGQWDVSSEVLKVCCYGRGVMEGLARWPCNCCLKNTTEPAEVIAPCPPNAPSFDLTQYVFEAPSYMTPKQRDPMHRYFPESVFYLFRFLELMFFPAPTFGRPPALPRSPLSILGM